MRSHDSASAGDVANAREDNAENGSGRYHAAANNGDDHSNIVLIGLVSKLSSCDKPQSSTSEPKDLSTVITDESIDKPPTSSESYLDADQESESDSRKQFCPC